jgi:uroporphyrinogen-III decarboxylase
MSKTPEELYKEREKRVLDAIALRKPDRVPVMAMFSFFPAKYSGLTVREVMNDPEKLWKAYWRTMIEFEPDMDHNPFGLRYLGPLLETLDFRQLKWPGHGVSDNISYQFVEGEYMRADEYDEFLFDPTDFMIRKYWPRVFGSLEGLGKISPPRHIVTYSMGAPFGFAPFGAPETAIALDALKKAGERSMEIASYAASYTQKAKEAGFPMQYGGFTQAPFDALGDYFRGTRGLMLDMYRRPKQVAKACEKLFFIMRDMALDAAAASGNPRIFIPLHKGLDGLMSLEQFDTFFWPTLRDLMLVLIDEGLVPCPMWEGNCTSRLSTIREMPEGRAWYAFEATDIFRAKEVLGDRVCIKGNVPLSMMATGTPEDVRAYCKKLVDVVGRDGGFIMDAAASLDHVKPENVRAMFEFTREYGVY